MEVSTARLRSQAQDPDLRHPPISCGPQTSEAGITIERAEFASDSLLEGAGFEPSVPRETERLLDGRSCWPPRAIESRRAIEGGPSYATHPVENRREGLCSNYFRRTRALALPTAGHDMTWPCNSPCLPRRA